MGQLGANQVDTPLHSRRRLSLRGATLFLWLFIGMRASSRSPRLLESRGGLDRGEQDATGGGSHMSCDQLIDRGRGAPELRKCDEVQERGNNLGWVETQEQEEAKRR